MKPENIKKLIKEWKVGLKHLRNDTKYALRCRSYYSAAASANEAETLAVCISELEHAIKQ